ncbi:MAG: alkaline phosphatase D family protein [Planctomycetota bacterium]
MLRVATPLLFAAVVAAQASGTVRLTHGPLLGHVDDRAAHLWARASAPGTYTMRLSVEGETPREAAAVADDAHDLTMHFVFDGLSLRTTYDVTVSVGGLELLPKGRSFVTTALPPAAHQSLVAFGSCANDVTFAEQPIWARIAARRPDALVLLGDTPYIDDGTVAARRRRHREFFAFAPVRDVLREVATWTTWDDHDYALNDTFGAVPGSETARPVFVDYHAHASYGDGERGIYTSFRRGPIEVFVLDTRSFADVETSPLAPDERSLLGATQLAWLQQGLRASTATFKVLACGMVWNGGVRDGKKDCWGNWLAERDALWAWLGAEQITGVVLVSGDVHRSRVILHPTKNLLGYDLPEFVTSPLAQNVIEANKVDVPGLVFDAGESSSCLSLRADLDTVDGGTLTAIFEAGDGRVFHERALTLADLRRSDAAVHYRAAVDELRRLLGEDLQHSRIGDIGRDDLLAEPARATDAEVRAEVASAAGALALLERASFTERCTFWKTSPESMVDELGAGLLMPVVRLIDIETAKGLQCLADGDTAELGRVVRIVLSTARHLRQQTGALPWMLATVQEQTVAELVRRVPLQDAGRDRVLEEVRRHLAVRPGVGPLVDTIDAEISMLLDNVLYAYAGEEQLASEMARREHDAVRRQALATLQPSMAAARALADGATEERWKALAEAKEELQSIVRDVKRFVRSNDPPDSTRFGQMLATLLAPSLERCLREHLEGERVLREVIE